MKSTVTEKLDWYECFAAAAGLALSDAEVGVRATKEIRRQALSSKAAEIGLPTLQFFKVDLNQSPSVYQARYWLAGVNMQARVVVDGKFVKENGLLNAKKDGLKDQKVWYSERQCQLRGPDDQSN